MKDIFKGVTVKILSIVVIIAILFAGGFIGYKQLKKKFSLEVTHNTVSNIEIIKEKLKAAAELNTGSYLCTVVSDKKDSQEIKGWKIPLTQKSIIIQYDGIVKAGIKDLTKAKIIEKGNTIVVKLPAVEITSVELDNDSLKVLDEKNNIFNPISVEDTNDAQKGMKEKMSTQAVEKGLLDIAKTNAEDIISNLLRSTTGDYEVKIEWQ
jgi:hypothetical protein